MSSEAKIEANRQNSQKSTGPTSEAGKKRSSLNACRHGLTAQTIVLPEEDLVAYEGFVSAIVASFDVQDVVEQQLAASFATFQWRINRAAALEENLFTLGNIDGGAENLQLELPQVHNALSNAKTYRDHSEEFARLSLYSNRLGNQAEKLLKQLKLLQAERKYRQQKEMPELVQIYKLHREQGLAFDPKAHGFVFSIPQIEAYLRRQNLSNPDFIAEEAASRRQKAA